MRILIATDAFPPMCGGSGWSTYELAKGLRALGHDITLVQVTTDVQVRRSAVYDGLSVDQYRAWAPRVPFVRNYFKNERLYSRLAAYLRTIIRRDSIDIVHAQHVLTGPPSVIAARAERVPVVCTVRDYWPICYWTDLVHDPSSATTCPGCSPAMMTRCLRPRAGVWHPLTLPMIPYMTGNLRRKRRRLASADAVVAVSTSVARDLRDRAAELRATRVETIPNPVDTAGIRAAADAGPRPMDGEYAIYVGKLAANKGSLRLLPAIERANLPWPLVVIGDGPQRAKMQDLARRSGRDVRFSGWLPRERVLIWLRHASLLVFTSYWPEPLSRVLLEASALGVPIAAMNTGGTSDIIIHEVTGLLADGERELGDHVARLVGSAPERDRLGAAARRTVEARFGAAAVVDRFQGLYRELIAQRGSATT
ncbi:MAG: glycosyltransferase family 4 protein [Gemmatimonadetes bacterium]|nr:glycosyltransferase family 4 protein [Gemmatimonadota bacterium]